MGLLGPRESRHTPCGTGCRSKDVDRDLGNIGCYIGVGSLIMASLNWCTLDREVEIKDAWPSGGYLSEVRES